MVIYDSQSVPIPGLCFCQPWKDPHVCAPHILPYGRSCHWSTRFEARITTPNNNAHTPTHNVIKFTMSGILGFAPSIDSLLPLRCLPASRVTPLIAHRRTCSAASIFGQHPKHRCIHSGRIQYVRRLPAPYRAMHAVIIRTLACRLQLQAPIRDARGSRIKIVKRMRGTKTHTVETISFHQGMKRSRAESLLLLMAFAARPYRIMTSLFSASALIFSIFFFPGRFPLKFALSCPFEQRH